MGLGDSTGKLTYLNIKKGKLSYKNSQGEASEAGYIDGFITKVEFEEKEWEGKKHEQCKLTIVDGEDKFQLQMKTDSGYFRNFCNAFKSGNPKLRTKITPTYKEDGAKKQSGCFVEQNGTALKWFYSKANENLDEIPKLEVHEVKKQKIYDGTNQIEFWKKWLLSLDFKEEIEAVSNSLSNQENGLNKKEDSKKATTKKAAVESPLDDQDDLPFN